MLFSLVRGRRHRERFFEALQRWLEVFEFRCPVVAGLEILKLHKNRIGDLGAEQLADFCKRSTTLSSPAARA